MTHALDKTLSARNLRAERLCIWSIVPFVVVYLVGFVGFAHFIPPPSPAISSAAVVALYAGNRLGIEIGQLIALVSSAFMLVWPAAVSAQMARIEQGPLPMLSLMQYGAAVVLALLFMLCSLIWSIAAYRADANPDIVRTLQDSGWLVFVMAYPEYLVQLGCIAAVGLADRRQHRFLPPWACYATLLTALAGIAGGFSIFCTRGPFAWNGILGFWLPVITFLCWMLFIMLPFTLKEIARQQRALV
jgi:membrane protein YdbS with pleckstrin-like domain